jgi:hypothetical protein
VSPSRLAVIIDGSPVPEEEARTFWARFSEHMDANAGDLSGFARKEGFASVHPEARSGVAVLIVSRSAEQRPYGSQSPMGSTGGSPGNQSGRRSRKKGRE